MADRLHLVALQPKFPALLDLVRSASVFRDRKSPMSDRVHLVNPKVTHSNLAVVVGNNSSGKSVLRRQMQEECNRHDFETLDLSMELRSHEDSEFRGEYYGNEEVLSTGVISISSVLRLISTSRNEKRKHVIMLDEPDVGLSDEVAAGVGVELANYLTKPSSNLVGALLITHRRAMLDVLLDLAPSVVFIGPKEDAPVSLNAWNTRKIVPQNPRAVIEAGVSLWNDMTDYTTKSSKK